MAFQRDRISSEKAAANSFAQHYASDTSFVHVSFTKKGAKLYILSARKKGICMPEGPHESESEEELWLSAGSNSCAALVRMRTSKPPITQYSEVTSINIPSM